MEYAEVNKLLDKIDAELTNITQTNDLSVALGQFMGLNEEILGMGIYNLYGNSLFSSSKNQDGNLGLTAFKSLLGLVGNQIDYILPPDANVQFIAPEDILIGISKIGADKIFAVVLQRNAKIATLVPNIIKIAKLLQGMSKKTESLSNSKCNKAYEQIIASKSKFSTRKNLLERFAR